MSEPRTSGGHGHPHGRPASWAVVALILVSVVVGGIALILHIMWLLFVCAGTFLAGIPLGAVVRIMDDTVSFVLPPGYSSGRRIEAHSGNPGGTAEMSGIGGPAATAGSDTAGTNTAGTNTAGTNTAGTNTAGTNTADPGVPVDAADPGSGTAAPVQRGDGARAEEGSGEAEPRRG
ncbi:MAG: hypothetical protein ACRDN9_14185 [Streptosporangiaceae bacterium]